MKCAHFKGEAGRLISAQHYKFFCTDVKIEALLHMAQDSFPVVF